MTGLVTIAIPVYKRLDYLPDVLRSVALQDYPQIELIVSDNGMNGSTVPRIVEEHYGRPCKFRQNPVSVNIPTHYHRILREATGEYFLWLADDDLISSNFVSELVCILEDHPDVSVAIAQQDIIDTAGQVVRRSSDQVPEFLAGDMFIRSWSTYGFENYATLLARTDDIRDCGGFPDFPGGSHVDNALLVKLCLRGSVAFSTRCAFQYRWHETSYGFSVDFQRLAEDMRRFLRFLDSDPQILTFANARPATWAELKAHLTRMNWHTYFGRWKTMYRNRLPPLQWVRMAFALPFNQDYYAAVVFTLTEEAKASVRMRVKTYLPWADKIYRLIRYGQWA